MKILIINSGSSSIKYQLIDMPEKKIIAKGLVERIAIDKGYIYHQYRKKNSWKEFKNSFQSKNHREALKKIHNLLSNSLKENKNSSEIFAIGHRVVHGGNILINTIEINEEVKNKIRSFFPLAPLHNPSNLIGIEVAQEIFPKARSFAVFDTAFHHNIPEKAHRYALPENFYKEKHIRVYGFHGISHQYVSKQAISYLKNKKSKIITLHLGNGASIAAIKEGISIDTSMGFGPNSGLIMGTRSGDLDPTIIFYLLENGYNFKNLFKILNKESGMLGISGKSDMRDIIKNFKNKEHKSFLAYEMYVYRIKKYIGSYITIMNGIDAIIFTGGIGENDSLIRSMVCSEMEFIGLILDEEKNKIQKKGFRELQTFESRIKILVIPTNEEIEIAKEVFKFL